ncbi:P1 family peptidase [Sporosarcina highlanderae]|uniref:P1 family peptidase n=1 Tax=Sporosarcina highlanderae TaxID=3035916 RepID=A0ABT8JMI4_9BACL|nr:P1 family peptidase [Sporosarcina highlanderae]MDN4606368.1 P1 family peptidase [Sporosarcina highlanderae]
MQRGKWNAITDVPGVKVGHVTLYDESGMGSACTGVTALLPHDRNLFEEKVPAASFVLNGFGKSVGLIQVEELGVIESPIMLSNTFSVGAVLEGTLQHMLAENPAIGDSTSSLNIVVGECNDSYLNSMRELKVRANHAIEAIRNAEEGPFEQGAVGAGKGMVCFGRKGGIGSSSRTVPNEGEEVLTVGVLTLTNFGRADECRIDEWLARNSTEIKSASRPLKISEEMEHEKPDGSIMIIVATDAPLNDRQLKRLAKRASIGLGRTGSTVHNGSGDIIIAFSNAYTIPHKSEDVTNNYTVLRDDAPIMNKLFKAAIEATEEAVYQSMIHAQTTVGRKGRVVERWLFDVESGAIQNK